MLSWLSEMFNKFGNALIAVLPHSPFKQYITSISVSEYVAYINWFIPVHTILVMLNTWILAIAVYYGYIIIARWIKLAS